MTYGNLFRKLTSTTGEIPIGIYRTEKQHEFNKKQSLSLDIEGLITMKLNKLGIDSTSYKTTERLDKNISFVLINPSSELELQSGDIVYLLKPGHLFSKLDVRQMPSNQDETSKPHSNFNINIKKLIFLTRKPTD